MSLTLSPLGPDRVLRLYLDAPPGNVIDLATIEALSRALAEHGRDPRVLALWFEGRGPNFSYGASVADHAPGEVERMLPAFHALFRTLLELSIPSVAVVRGKCLGGGLELAAFASVVFATPDAELGQPESRLAVFAPMASILLPWRIGGGPAMDLLLSGRSIGGTEAKSLGLVTEVGPDPAALAAAYVERELAKKSGVAIRYAERAARSTLIRQLDGLAELERFYLSDLMATADAKEGILSFLERRRPNYPIPDAAPRLPLTPEDR